MGLEHRTAAQRGLATLLALFFAGAQLVSLAHETAQLHLVCPDHDGLVHASAGGAAAQSSSVGGEPSDEPGTHGHRHCVLSASEASLDQPPAIWAQLARPTPLAAVQQEIAVPELPVGKRRLLLLVAPKQSPPT